MSADTKRRGRPPKADPKTDHAAEETPAAVVVAPETTKRGGIPPCPDGGIEGDKAAEVVDWWFTHHPAEARERYKGRKGANVERWLRDE